MTFENYNGDKSTDNASGFYKLYSYNLVCFMDSETYKEQFGEDVELNAFLILQGDLDLSSSLLKIDGYTQTYHYYLLDYLDSEVFKIIAKAVVAVYIIVAVLMSIFVILNLLMTYVEEKKKELLVLMINGYSLKQAKNYITIDMIILTIIGLLIGVAGGIYAGSLAVQAFESEYIYLLTTINLPACLIGVVVTLVLTIIMSSIAKRKIEKFELIEINGC